MAERRRAPLVLTLLSVAAAACGGATSAPIDNSNTSGGTSSSSSGGSGGGTSSGSSSGTSSGGADGGGSTTDAGADPGVVACGNITCKTNGGAPSIDEQYCCLDKDGAGVCKQGPVTTCEGSRIACDETADCPDGKSVCCVEATTSSGPGGQRIQTRCMPTCITGAPRTQVCKTDAECTQDSGGKCQAFDCEGYPPSMRFCSRPFNCK